MNVYRINTTAYSEEDFFLLTSLTRKQIFDVIMPIVMNERDGESEYDNEMLVDELRLFYPKATINMFTDFETISI